MEALSLINAEFPVEIAGETYQVKKANLEKVIQFQTRFSELTDAKDPAAEIKSAAYCLFLILKDAKPEITEEWVLKNLPGDVDFANIIEQFGFMSRQKMTIIKALTQRNVPTPTEPAGTSSLQ